MGADPETISGPGSVLGAGVSVFERDPDGVPVAARVYDDVEPPRDRS